MENKIYYDTFTNKPTTHKDPYAAPERYYEIVPSLNNDQYKETWLCSNGAVLDIVYTSLDIESGIISQLRTEALQTTVEHQYLISWTIPKDKYDEIYNKLYKKIINYPDMIKDISLREVNFNRLDEFLSWDNNWNGYGASAFNKDLINYAKELIALIDEDIQPEVFPTQGSSIQFEWNSGVSESFTNFYFELELLKNDIFNVFYILNNGLEMKKDEFIIHINKENINDFIRLIVDSRQVIEINPSKDLNSFTCPKCKTDLSAFIKYNFKYCPECGQLIRIAKESSK